MVPKEYRLDTLSVRLIERLDSARKSHVSPEQAAEEAHRISTQVVDAAVAEWEDMEWAEDASRQSALLRTEIERTLLPRWLSIAEAQAAAEADHHGLSKLHPMGTRLAILVGGLAAFWASMRVLRGTGFFVILVPLIITLLMPEIAAWLSARKYRAALQELITDMGRIQDSEGQYQAPLPISSQPRLSAPSSASQAVPTPRRSSDSQAE